MAAILGIIIVLLLIEINHTKKEHERQEKIREMKVRERYEPDVLGS